jgi:hypothetical protein
MDQLDRLDRTWEQWSGNIEGKATPFWNQIHIAAV